VISNAATLPGEIIGGTATDRAGDTPEFPADENVRRSIRSPKRASEPQS
jgi:hypothetical protein